MKKLLLLTLSVLIQIMGKSNLAHADGLLAGTRILTCTSNKDSKVKFDIINNAGKNSLLYDGNILYNLVEIEEPKVLHYKMTLDSVTTNIIVASMEDGTRNFSATSTDTDHNGKKLAETSYLCKPTF